VKRLLGLLIIISFIIALSFVLIVAGDMLLPNKAIRGLAILYLRYAFNKDNPDFTVFSPEAVTSIVWDYRGLDTVFETMVFFLAIIGAVALARGVVKLEKPKEGELGLSIIVKTVTRITSVLIIVVAASIALHGHLTPGGGFQAGSTAAVASALIVVVFSLYGLLKVGVSKDRLLALRSLGLMGIFLTSLLIFIIGLIIGSTAFIMQNQPKPLSQLGYPYEIGGVLVSGTPLILNIFEAIAVVMAFTLLFLVLSISEEDALDALRGGEKHEH